LMIRSNNSVCSGGTRTPAPIMASPNEPAAKWLRIVRAASSGDVPIEQDTASNPASRTADFRPRSVR
jgi:hypothetical protein